jgi:hypothetical protein
MALAAAVAEAEDSILIRRRMPAAAEAEALATVFRLSLLRVPLEGTALRGCPTVPGVPEGRVPEGLS